jgi:hypothetical protein
MTLKLQRITLNLGTCTLLKVNGPKYHIDEKLSDEKLSSSTKGPEYRWPQVPYR